MKIIKRSNRHNSIYRYENTKGKFWGFRLRYYDDTGHRRERTKNGFKTEREAFREFIELQSEIEQGLLKQNTDFTINDWMEHYIDMNKPNDKGEGIWSINSYTSKVNIFNREIKPTIGNIKLDKLTLPMYEKLFLKPLIEKNSPASIRSYHIAVSAALNAAVERGIIKRNPISRAKLPRNRVQEDNFLTPHQIHEIMTYVDKKEEIFKSTFIYTLIYTGMRMNEARAIKWKHIDFKNKRISIFTQINDYRGKQMIGPTKGRNKRVLDVDDVLIKKLKEYRKHHIQFKLFHGISTKEEDFVFIDDRTFKVISKFVIFYTLKKIKEYYGYSVLTPHTFRHTQASILLMSGQSHKKVARRLGNSERVVIQTYSHIIPDITESEVDAFSNTLLLGQKVGQKPT